MSSTLRRSPLLGFCSLARAGWRRVRGDGRLAARSRRLRAAFYTSTWRRAAEELGAESSLRDGVFEIRLRDRKVCVRANYTTLDHERTLALAGDKPRVHRILRAAGLTTPRFVEFDLGSLEVAARFLADCGAACVVKPARGTGAGQGITTGIRSRSDLVWAAVDAARYGTGLLLEEQVAGENYRLLLLDGSLLDAVRRDPPCVMGDGRASIRALVNSENQRRSAGFAEAQVLLRCDGEMRSTLARQELDLSSVPAAGRRVVLKTVVNENAARETVPLLDQLCGSIAASAREAARCVGARLAGVDVITTDPSRPLEETGGVILEVNTTPGLYHHKRGQACPVATEILAAMLDARTHVSGPAR